MDVTRGITAAELNELIGRNDYREFLNPKNELYRERRMKEQPPAREEAIRLMAENPNLIRRPILVAGRRMVLGFQPEEMATLADERAAKRRK